MRTPSTFLIAAGLSLAGLLAYAQPPAGPGGPERGGPAATADSFLERLFAYDTNQDKQLTKAELTDKRLHPLFDRADANHDGIATRDEFVALYDKESPSLSRGGRGGPGGSPGGESDRPPVGGPGGFGPGGRGGRPGFGGPAIGKVLPPFVQDELRLSDKQKQEIEALQKEVDGKIAKILTADQKKALDEMQTRGPGGRGGPPGRGPGGAAGAGAPPN
jgi:hypothetical protein